MYFRNYGLGKIWLGNCVKSPISDSPSRSNKINGRKHCSNLNNNTFTIFIDHS